MEKNKDFECIRFSVFARVSQTVVFEGVLHFIMTVIPRCGEHTGLAAGYIFLARFVHLCLSNSGLFANFLTTRNP